MSSQFSQADPPVAGRLSPDAVRRLAALAGAGKAEIEAAIAVAPFSLRVQLYSQIPPLIADEPTEVDALEGRPIKVRLTPAGESAVRECAEWLAEHGSVRELEDVC
jgi:hypothetical protein